MKFYITHQDRKLVRVIARNKSICIKEMKKYYPEYEFNKILTNATSGYGGGEIGHYEFKRINIDLDGLKIWSSKRIKENTVLLVDPITDVVVGEIFNLKN